MDSQSHECETLIQCYSTLVSCIQLSPNDIADKLLPTGILAPKTLQDLSNQQLNPDEKARRLLDTVLIQVKIDPQVYHTFTTALKEAGLWTKTVVHELEHKHTSLSGKSENPQSSASLQENNDTMPNNPSPDTLNSIQDQDSGTKTVSTRSIYQEIDHGKPVAVDFNKREHILKWETSQIRGKFAVLLMKVLKSIEKQQVTVKRFAIFLQQIKAVDAASNQPVNHACYLLTKSLLKLNINVRMLMICSKFS